MNFILIDTALSNLHKCYGDSKINKEQLYRMLSFMQIIPYKYQNREYIASAHYYELCAYIEDYVKGAPVNEVFDIGL